MSQFLSSDQVTIGEAVYKPEGGVVTLPDECDLVAINRLGLTKYLPAPTASASEEPSEVHE